MNLREKTLAIIAITFAVVFAVILALSFGFYLNSAANLERQQAEKDLHRTLHAIDNDLNGLERTLVDWAWWDDTYEFARNLTPSFVEKNLDGSTLQNLRLNYFVIVGTDSNVLFAKGHDLRTGEERPVPDWFLAGIRENSGVFTAPRGEQKAVGIMTGKDMPVFIGSTQILTSSGGGPSPGFLVLAREIDAEEIARISTVSGEQVSIALTPGHGNGFRAVFIPRPLVAARISIDQATSGTLTKTAIIGDYGGGPALVISAPSSRDIYLTALILIREFLIIITLLMVLSAAILLVIMDRLVLRRLATLVDRVRDRGSAPQSQHLPPMKGEDEFVELDKIIRESQEKIRETEALYRRIVETAQEGICMLDPEHRITFANERMAAMIGHTPGTLTGILFQDLIPEDGRAEYSERMAGGSAGRSQRFECRLLGKNGIPLWVLISATPVFSGNTFSGSFAMMTDITDRKRAEISLELATKKLTALNVITFNDLQNQLFKLQGYLELCEGLAEGTKMKEYLDRQQDVAEKIRQQILFAQDIQKMGSKPPSWQNVNRVFLFAISHLDLSKVKREIALGSIEVYADPLLENVLFSLVDNSLRHGKTVTSIRVCQEETDKGIAIVYEDNGTGIPPEMKERIFEQRYTSGTGVSLFLAREILSITGITIRETGTYTAGARFEIHVPRSGCRLAGNDPADPAP